MLLICYGMPKSASSFAFTLAKDIAQTISNQWKLKQELQEELRNSFISGSLGSTLKKIDCYIPHKEIYVIKTHDLLDEETKELLLKGKAKAIISYRDPYDIVVSLKDTGEREQRKPQNKQRHYFTQIQSYEDALKKIPNILKNAKSWMDYKDTNLAKISFTEISQTPSVVAQKIADYMEVNVDVHSIVEPYVSNKESILEFNKGLEGRGYKEFSLPEENLVKKKMDEFLKLYF